LAILACSQGVDLDLAAKEKICVTGKVRFHWKFCFGLKSWWGLLKQDARQYEGAWQKPSFCNLKLKSLISLVLNIGFSFHKNSGLV